MDSFNLSAFLTLFLVVLWMAYAVPRIAERRRAMSDAETDVRASAPTLSRDIAVARRTAARTPEVSSPMADSHPLLRPADPTSRPRFSDAPGERVDTLAEERGRMTVLRVFFAVLLVATVALTVTSVLALTPWWSAGAAAVVLALYVWSLRRAEMHRRARVRQARFRDEETRRLRAEAAGAQADAVDTEKPTSAPADTTGIEQGERRAAEQVAAPGEWVPRPVPVPTYALRGDVDDMATRHAAHRAAMGPMALEAADVEEREATAEQEFPQAVDLRLDEVMERRRTA